MNSQSHPTQHPSRRVALVTYHELPRLADDDRLLIPALARHGIDAIPAIWNDPAVDWSQFAAAVVRSTWDYYHDLPAFLRWIAHLEERSVPLYNPPDVLRWNADKRYLKELESAGIPVVPTRWVESDDPVSLLEVLAACQWDEAVVKPAVSASAAVHRRGGAGRRVVAALPRRRFQPCRGEARQPR